MNLRRTVFRLVVPCLVFWLAGCAATAVVQRQPLAAMGPSTQDAPILKRIVPASAADGKLLAGDKIVAIDDKPITSIQEMAQVIYEGSHSTLTVSRGEMHLDMPVSALADTQSNKWNALVLGDGETFTLDTQSATGPTMRAAYVLAGRVAGYVATSVWRSQPNLIEVELRITAPNDCTDCQLRNVAVLDMSRRAWLSIVATRDAAFAIVPEVGQPGQPIAVPPPTVVGSTSTTTMQGTVNAQTYGNTTTGTYSGNAYTTTAPIYDYSNQYAALGHNLGVAIRNAQIETANRERVKFWNVRLGNLRVGTLNPGEIVTGHLFFAAPIGFDGPYMVFVDGGENALGFGQFSKRQ